MSYFSSLSDDALVTTLREGVKAKLEGDWEYSIPDPHKILQSIKEIYERSSRDGLEAHPSFRKIAEAMAGLPEAYLDDDREIARSLVPVLTLPEANPWRALLSPATPRP